MATARWVVAIGFYLLQLLLLLMLDNSIPPVKTGGIEC